MIKIGMIGLSDGNGHPYSFSAIINGFNDTEMKNSGWLNIYSYLKERDSSDFGISNALVTHIWTQDINESKKISRASNIPYVVEDYKEMISSIDAVIVARDDFASHKEIATHFLEAGKYVFIDKPLSLNISDLAYFRPFMSSYKLFSCSGIRYAPELDKIRMDINKFGQIKLVRGTTIRSWEKYAIHMLDGIFSVIPFNVESVQYVNSLHESFILHNSDGTIIQIDALGEGIAEPVFRIEFFGDNAYYRADTLNAFDAFKRTLCNFVNMIDYGKVRNNLLSLELMKVLIAGNLSRERRMKIALSDLEV